MAETLSETVTDKSYLYDRQNQFAALLGVDAEQLRCLQLCETCGGYDYQWTDWTLSSLPEGFTVSSAQAISYRHYLADTACRDCDATGFQGGSFNFSNEEWIKLGEGKAE